MITEPYDIVIVGGGLVGLSLALALGQSQSKTSQRLKVAVIEPYPMMSADQSANPSFDARSTALSYSTERIYRRLGIWDGVVSSAAAIRRIHVSDKGQWGATRLVASEQGMDCYGYVVPNEVLGRNLYRAFHQQRQVELVASLKVSSMVAQSGGYLLTLGDSSDIPSRQLSARLVVVTDGGRSNLAEQLGISYKVSDYHQHAVIANIGLSRSHEEIAYERFTGEGAMALLPLADYISPPGGENDVSDSTMGLAGKREFRSALVWTVPSRQAPGLLEISDADFLARLQKVFGHRAGRFIRVGERHTYPLQLKTASEQFRQGLVLLGNSAHTLHPVAGQGYNLALRDAMTLAECIRQTTTVEQVGSLEVLNHYFEMQRADQARTIMGSDGLLKLFGSKASWIRQARSLGLVSLNLLGLAKEQFTEVAMGVSGVAREWR
ncbi:2-octaprenyl-6-methoxyphenyl hydroxylase [Hahella sp. CCB-MM4]|uniref:2-octaprenyl-6-methoxyphenyl hydroxylase n=1 Tax=Hahella sp. (strain CCB-MM4) TaxID=1926491 RepID=UPI000B9C4AB0|nr:2-octaprenyl-6-methoxyphenyl hydroxylase [Hahella sp. CCB-MM4]OZG74902.1 2-octaprenyl-6-methoxyphenyl hydroxylase [Hahella sp. CCB-MM4]